MKEEAEKVLKEIIKIIWNYEVKVEGFINERGIDLKIITEEKNLPSLIGRNGKNIRLLRRIMKLWASIHKCNVNIQKI